eukprot:PhF_6_TR28355/c0_g1_i1/m.42054
MSIRPDITYRRCDGSDRDIKGIQRVASLVDMTQSKSFIWSDDVLRNMITTKEIYVVVAECPSFFLRGTEHSVVSEPYDNDDELVVIGVGGVSIALSWSDTHYDIWINGAMSSFDDCRGPFAVCRGLLVQPNMSKFGIGRTLHAERVRYAFDEGSRFLLLSARGMDFQNSVRVTSPVDMTSLAGEKQDTYLLQLTYPSSKGVVHIARKCGMEFAGIDPDDGGAVWGQDLTAEIILRHYVCLDLMSMSTSIGAMSFSVATETKAIDKSCDLQQSSKVLG